MGIVSKIGAAAVVGALAIGPGGDQAGSTVHGTSLPGQSSQARKGA